MYAIPGTIGLLELRPKEVGHHSSTVIDASMAGCTAQ